MNDDLVEKLFKTEWQNWDLKDTIKKQQEQIKMLELENSMLKENNEKLKVDLRNVGIQLDYARSQVK